MVPTLRKLRELTPAQASSENRGAKREWGVEQRGALSVGLAILFTGLILTSLFGLLYARLDLSIPADIAASREKMLQDVDQLPADELFALWKAMIRPTELDQQPPNKIVGNRKMGKMYFQLIVVGAVISVGGLLTTGWFAVQGARASKPNP